MSRNEKIKDIMKMNISNNEKNKLIQQLYMNNNILEKEKEIKCNHYKRRCKLYSPCCNKLVNCRLCHDENNICEIKFNRFDVKRIRCIECNEDQVPSNKCIKCEISFSENFCEKCNLWTDDKITHCDKCGICRKGDKLYHCDICDMCWPNETHPCNNKSNSRLDKCPICLDILFTSTKSATILKCGHQMHADCLNNYVKTNYNCPICKKSLFDMTQHWNMLRQHKQNIQIPEDLKNLKLKISCYDCEKENEIDYFIDGLLECPECNSFNTQKINIINNNNE